MIPDRPIRYVYLETTNHCNLDCVFCNRRDVVDNTNMRHMTLEAWRLCLSKLAKEPIKQAKLMGLGEPFFHPNFDQITHEFKKIFPECFTISATNLQYKITERFFQAAENLDLLYFSIDGYRDTYEKARPGAKWDRLIDSLDKIEQHYCKENTNKTVRFEINFVATIDTIDSLDNVCELANKYSVIDDLRINVAQWWGEGDEIDLKVSQSLISKLKQYSSKVKGKAPWDFNECWWPREGIYMTVDGQLKICCMNTSTNSIGNLFTDDLDTLRSSGKLLSTLKGLEENKQDIEHCMSCSYKTLSPVLAEVFNKD